ncbi:cytochrome c oxidase-assembly factor cox16, mitochondrial precursor, putative [Talaromyces stipitatus ATCC 10500]|uniref:Cytochrome c oxidase assembly protein COX16, mitochondrial n=1 Tax=Talaromyces stipitatus (strain ATCC 10500 / CBS 375.48 / QM 6759 / NRRL 1006) TaxID=441959 RepID=B8MA47_TALSN|nr:cytochrome c oxidase-assembly factor cox16, mitochondrial precursor, putative [Talaromyces stipitatus ATCC 10500]EED18376.1 cytochrome c oxidase-assembly factor cox16, mitochondrial precursor, putative [Talaromyces stipitatus ATCC 10500]
MPAFGSKTFRRATTASSTLGERLGTLYRAKLPRHPFLLFGLPFISVIVAASFVLTPATALRYERHDRKVRQLDQEEAMALGLKGENGEESIRRNPRRHVIGSDRDEYYKLMAKDLDDWEQTRVKRFKGEPDGRFD